MNFYLAITFLHVTGAIFLFVSWALEYDYLKTINQSDTTNEEVTSSKKPKNYTKLGGIAAFITLATGIGLMIALSRHGSWMIMAMVSVVLIKITEVFFSRKAMAVKTDKPRNMFYLLFSVKLRIAIGIGIIALMVFKTSGILSSLFVVLIALIGGACLISVFRPLKRGSMKNQI
jgi:hypothetical protein